MKDIANVKPGSPAAWFLAARPLTLPASIAPVILGWSLAALYGPVSALTGAACLTAAVMLQISANLANDLFDSKSGVDSKDRLGPLRVTQSGLLTQKQVVAGLAFCMTLAVIAGLYAVFQAGWWLLLLGGVCMIGALAYTAGPFPLARLGMGEIAALLFFGSAACTGTFAVLSGYPTVSAWTAGLIPGFHAAAIMAVNNLRDISSDRRSGKMTLAVRIGEHRARQLAAGLVVAGNASVIPLALALNHTLLFAALLFIPFSFPLLRSMLRTPRSKELNPVLARTGQWELLTCLVIAALLHTGV